MLENIQRKEYYTTTDWPHWHQNTDATFNIEKLAFNQLTLINNRSDFMPTFSSFTSHHERADLCVLL